MRIRSWIAWGLLIFLVLLVGAVAFGFSAAGYTKFVVQTGSMAPTIMPGDLAIDRASGDGLAVGDVITFHHDDEPALVTHRIVQITSDGIKTKGDANRTADVWTVRPDQVVGVVAFVIPKAGYVVVFLSQPAGLIAIVVAVVGLVLLWRLFFPTEETADSSETTDADGGPDPALSADGDSGREAFGQALSTGRHSADDDDDSEIDIPGVDYLKDGEPDVSGVDSLSSERTSST